jgi:hypothetical protein
MCNGYVFVIMAMRYQSAVVLSIMGLLLFILGLALLPPTTVWVATCWCDDTHNVTTCLPISWAAVNTTCGGNFTLYHCEGNGLQGGTHDGVCSTAFPPWSVAITLILMGVMTTCGPWLYLMWGPTSPPWLMETTPLLLTSSIQKSSILQPVSRQQFTAWRYTSRGDEADSMS